MLRTEDPCGRSKDPKGLREILAVVAKHATVALLVPEGRTIAAGVTEVGFDPAAPDGVLRALILKLDLASEVEAIVVAPPSARIVVDTRRELAWLDGVPLTLSGTDFAFLTALASASGAVVSSAAIAKAVGSGPRDGSSVPKQKARLLRALRESLEAAGRGAETDLERLIVAASKQGYRLAVESFVR